MPNSDVRTWMTKDRYKKIYGEYRRDVKEWSCDWTAQEALGEKYRDVMCVVNPNMEVWPLDQRRGTDPRFYSPKNMVWWWRTYYNVPTYRREAISLRDFYKKSVSLDPY